MNNKQRLTTPNTNLPKEWKCYKCKVLADGKCKEGNCAACDRMGDIINRLGQYEDERERQSDEAQRLRMTDDDPQDNFKTMLNMVYPAGDGWAKIRHGEDHEHPYVDDFCFMLCEKQGCDVSDVKAWPREERDEYLCACAFENCPVATVYMALAGYSHLRSRLKMYEDAGIPFPKKTLHPLTPAERARTQGSPITMSKGDGTDDA